MNEFFSNQHICRFPTDTANESEQEAERPGTWSSSTQTPCQRTETRTLRKIRRRTCEVKATTQVCGECWKRVPMLSRSTPTSPYLLRGGYVNKWVITTSNMLRLEEKMCKSADSERWEKKEQKTHLRFMKTANKDWVIHSFILREIYCKEN